MPFDIEALDDICLSCGYDIGTNPHCACCRRYCASTERFLRKQQKEGEHAAARKRKKRQAKSRR